MTTPRVLALRALSPLPQDLQRKIFGLLYPTLPQAAETVERICDNSNDYQNINSRLASFLHSERKTVSFMLEAEDIDYIEHCCTKLYLEFIRGGVVYEHPEMSSWPQRIFLTRSAGWAFYKVSQPCSHGSPAVPKRPEQGCDSCGQRAFWLFRESPQHPEHMICYECCSELMENGHKLERYRWLTDSEIEISDGSFDAR